MMGGIDISNWQKGIVPSSLGVDFCICKATEGVGFVDKQCDTFIQDCVNHGILWGFYHFAKSNSPEDEARYFHEHTKGYTGKGIPVLDYEVWGKNSDVAWCERFMQAYHDLTGIWAMLYISASHCSDFTGSWIPDRCGLWVAGYPRRFTSFSDVVTMPYDISPWKFCAIWQFTSSLRLPAWSGDLDGDFAYMDAAGWNAYAGSSEAPSTPAPSTPDYEALAAQVWEGMWGNGEARKNTLNTAYGEGTYEKVQAIVNKGPDYETLATQVIRGDWGNGSVRKNGLNSTYGTGTYEKVQKIVNARLKKS